MQITNKLQKNEDLRRKAVVIA